MNYFDYFNIFNRAVNSTLAHCDLSHPSRRMGELLLEPADASWETMCQGFSFL